MLAAIEKCPPDILCVAVLPPGGLRHMRYFCKRIHAQFPNTVIWILRPGGRTDPSEVMEQLAGDGVRFVATSFSDAVAQFAQLPLAKPTVAA